MLRALAFMIAVLTVPVCWAGTFSANGGQGVSTVGPAPTDDYPSLSAAANDFSGRAGGCTGDWTLLINTPTLVEPNNIAFGNATNGYHVTVKPAAGVTAQVQFTTTTANPAWSGNWLIGTAIAAPQDSMTTTSNFTIDGSNNGTSSRNLTVTNAVTSVETQLIRVVGGCTNTTIRNVILNSRGTGLNLPIEFTARRTAAGLNYIASGCHVENCDITVLSGSNGQDILFRSVSSGTLATGIGFDNVTITSNTISGINVAVNLGLVANATVEDNTLSMTAISSSTQPNGIQHNTANYTSGWTINIARNRFVTWDNLTSSGLGMQVYLNPTITSPATGTYNIYNNFFAGFQNTGACNTGLYRAIYLFANLGAVPVVTHIYHNSFNMPDLPTLTAANYQSYHAVGLHSGSVNCYLSGVLDIKDNIFLMEQNNGAVFYRTNQGNTTSATVTCDYNTFYLGAAGAKMACYINGTAAANYAALADWQAAGFDTHSLIVDPRVPPVPGMGKWVSSNNLHFDAPASALFRGVDVGVTTDIDNDTRTAPLKGADEVPLTSVTAATDWTSYW